MTHNSFPGQVRENIRPGMKVAVVLKKDQLTNTLTEGVVFKRFLSKL